MAPEQFDHFISTNKNRIYNYILRFVDIDEDAQDILQDVFIAFYDRLDSIKHETALPYMYRMAHNMALNWKKASKRHVLKPSEDFERIPDKPIVTENYTALNQAIALLPVKLAMVVQLFYYDKLSYKEIASELKLSSKAVDSLLNRARRKLRDSITINEHGSFELRSRG